MSDTAVIVDDGKAATIEASYKCEARWAKYAMLVTKASDRTRAPQGVNDHVGRTFYHLVRPDGVPTPVCDGQSHAFQLRFEGIEPDYRFQSTDAGSGRLELFIGKNNKPLGQALARTGGTYGIKTVSFKTPEEVTIAAGQPLHMKFDWVTIDGDIDVHMKFDGVVAPQGPEEYRIAGVLTCDGSRGTPIGIKYKNYSGSWKYTNQNTFCGQRKVNIKLDGRRKSNEPVAVELFLYMVNVQAHSDHWRCRISPQGPTPLGCVENPKPPTP